MNREQRLETSYQRTEVREQRVMGRKQKAKPGNWVSALY